MNSIVNKKMTVVFEDEEKETVVKFHTLISDIQARMLDEGIETVEINSNDYPLEVISQIDDEVYCMF